MKISYVLVAVLVGIVVLGRPATVPASPGSDDGNVTAREFRDPFAPFRPKIDEPAEPRSALERLELGSLSLKAVILGTGEPRAMVEDDAGLGYTLAIGTRVGIRRGVVVSIEPDRIVIEEQTVDFYGERKTHAVTLRLRSEERTSAR